MIVTSGTICSVRGRKIWAPRRGLHSGGRETKFGWDGRQYHRDSPPGTAGRHRVTCFGWLGHTGMRTLRVGSFQIVPLLRNHSLASSRHASPATKTRALGVTMLVAMAVCTAPSSVIRHALMANASPVATARAPSVRDVALPITEANDYSGSLGVLDGQIVVGDNSGGNVCRLAIVQPVTLTVLSEPSTSCNDPRLLGEDVMPVESVPSVGSPVGVVRISVRNKATGAIPGAGGDAV